MSEDQKKQLENQLWEAANDLRGKMNADEYRDYLLGFIFYKYLSEKIEIYADKILKSDGIKYVDIDESIDEGAEYVDAVLENALEDIGFFLKPSELFHKVALHGPANDRLIEDLYRILNNIERSTQGEDSEDDFAGLFSEMDLNANKLGKSVADRNKLISKVLLHLDKIDFKLEDSKIDVLGDAYEILISKFASGAGKKAGEFYTPQEVSEVLAQVVTDSKSRLKNVYDPTCGSGSLLLRVAKHVESVGFFYGQELNNTTFNLARMNMLLHDVRFDKFEIKQDNTLENPQHAELRFEAIVANPPFSAKWSADPLHLQDERFSQYGVLAPTKPADYAFIQHMLYQLDENGTMAVVMPHGALYRGKSEGVIRKFIVQEKNYLDAVIGLPPNIFYQTDTPTCVMVFKKCREDSENIVFIDGSRDFEKGTQNRLREEDINKIINAYRNRKEIKKYCHVADLSEIEKNKYNLNIARYVDTSIENPDYNIETISKNMVKAQSMSAETQKSIERGCKELGIDAPQGSNLKLLKDYQSWLMQSLFTRQTRFKNDGKEFEAWQDVQLKEILKERKERNTNYTHTEVFSVAKNRGVVNQIEHLGRSYSAENISNYKVVHPLDVVYTKSPTKDFPFGIIKQNKLGRFGVVSVLYAVFIPKTKEIGAWVDLYFSNWINTYNYLNPLVNIGAKNTMNIGNNDFLDGAKLTIPTNPQEIQKITELLGSVSAKINEIENGIS